MSIFKAERDVTSLSHQQSMASDPRAHVFLRANAGSGKTRTLVNRVARLLLNGAKADKILCLTFTKAAANEMQTRLFKTLGDWAVSSDSDLEAELWQIGEDRPNLKEARSLFARALETPGGLKIQTLHAFCEKLLRRFPLEAGLAPGFRVLDQALAELLKAHVRRALFNSFDFDQAFCEARDRLIVRLGELGFESLLTQFMHKRYFFTQWLEAFPKAIDPLLIIKAQLGLNHEFNDLYGTDLKNLIGSSAGKDVIESLSAEKNETPKKLAVSLDHWARHYEPTESHFLSLRDVFFNAKGEPRALIKKLKTAENFINTFFAEIELRYQHLIGLKVANETNDLKLVFDKIRHQWEILTTDYGVLSFDDQIETARHLLNRSDMADWVRYKLDEGLDHILVDEAQDTSQAQWSIISPLADEFFDGQGQFGNRWRSYFAVGDEKQSIYGFQGADPNSFRTEEARIRYKADHCGESMPELRLDHSFRSTPAILQLVDQVFNDPERAFSVTLDPLLGLCDGAVDRPISRHIPCRLTPFGRVDIYPTLRQLKQETRGLDDEEIDGPQNVDEALAWQIASDIRSALDKGLIIYDKNQPRPVNAGDILVLVRDRNSVFEHLIRALKTLGVPIMGADRLKLENHIVFKDIRALMRVAVSPEDDLSLALLLRSPFIGISEEDLFKLSIRPKGQSLWQCLKLKQGFEEAKSFLFWACEAAKNLSVFDFCARALERRCPAGLSMRQRIFKRLGAECEDVVVETLNLAAFCEKQGIMSVASALKMFEYHATEIKREQGGERPQSVRIMTVHGAKGLEAPWVIVIEKIKGKKPNKDPLICFQNGFPMVFLRPIKPERPEIINNIINDEEIREEQEDMRLLYVALTRACDRLSLYSAQGLKVVKSPKGGHWSEAVRYALEQIRQVDEGIIEEVMVPAYCDYAQKQGDEVPIVIMGKDEFAPVFDAKSGAHTLSIPDWLNEPHIEHEPLIQWQAAGRLGEDEARGKEAAASPLAGYSDKGLSLGRYDRGLIIHRLLEIVPQCKVDERASVLTKILSGYKNLSEAQADEIYKSVMGVLTHQDFSPLFGPNSKPEVALSGEIGIDKDGKPLVVSGQIDRLVIDAAGVWVLDYKTNRPAPENIENAPVSYVRQMAAYVALLRKIMPDKTVKAAFIWTDGPRLMPLTDELIDQTLKEILRH